jgi:hypothetical protein
MLFVEIATTLKIIDQWLGRGLDVESHKQNGSPRPTTFILAPGFIVLGGMAKALSGTICSSSVCGAASNTKMYICGPMKASVMRARRNRVKSNVRLLWNFDAHFANIELKMVGMNDVHDYWRKIALS